MTEKGYLIINIPHPMSKFKKNQLANSYFALNDTTIFTVMSPNVMKSTDRGLTWKLQAILGDWGYGFNNIYFSENNTGYIFGVGSCCAGGTPPIVLKSTDSGNNWAYLMFPYDIHDVHFMDKDRGFAVCGGIGFHGHNSAVLVTDDGGENWRIQIDGLNSHLNAIHFKNGFGWAVGDNGLVLRTEDGATWIDENNNKVYPSAYKLHQNFPNPFNPRTVISWQVGATSMSPAYIDLSIYNVLGQKVTTLISEKQKAGFHFVEWDASGMASGIYYYRLQAEGFVETKKLVLVR